MCCKLETATYEFIKCAAASHMAFPWRKNCCGVRHTDCSVAVVADPFWEKLGRINRSVAHNSSLCLPWSTMAFFSLGHLQPAAAGASTPSPTRPGSHSLNLAMHKVTHCWRNSFRSITSKLFEYFDNTVLKDCYITLTRASHMMSNAAIRCLDNIHLFNSYCCNGLKSMWQDLTSSITGLWKIIIHVYPMFCHFWDWKNEKPQNCRL